jgi:hypothetical protein
MLQALLYFSSLNTFTRKGKDPDSYLRLIDPAPGGPKTCSSGSGSPTLVFSNWYWSRFHREILFTIVKLQFSCDVNIWMRAGKPAGVRGKGTRSLPSGPERSGGGLSLRPLSRRPAGPGCDVTSGQGGEHRHPGRDGQGGVLSSHRQWTRLGRRDSHQR